MKRCLICGWVNADDAKTCLQCHHPFEGEKNGSDEAKSLKDSKAILSGTVGLQRGTLPPRKGHSAADGEPVYVDENTRGGFSLMMIPESNEDIMPYAERYEGHEVKLNRSNTDRTNKTITSKEQARLVNIDNRWYIEDHSDMKSTFVRASRPIELHSGDVILLGDRLFRFDDLNEEPAL